MLDILIPSFMGSIANKPTPMIDSRLLHHFSGTEQPFLHWVQDFINQHSCQQDIDYLIVQPEQPHLSRRHDDEYHLTVALSQRLEDVSSYSDLGVIIRRLKSPLTPSLPHSLTPSLPHSLTDTCTPFLDHLQYFPQYQSVAPDSDEVPGIQSTINTLDHIIAHAQAHSPSMVPDLESLSASFVQAWTVVDDACTAISRLSGVLQKNRDS